jgi:phosphoribosylformimino-5-aminoimidazole carboxamide ribotide isomerase
VLIPSIDLMGGKIVQLVQGEKKALEFDDFEPWIERFLKFPLVQLIDLDAAMRQGSNRELIAQFASRLAVQVGGGIRTVADAESVLAAGGRAVIIGSALIRDGRPNVELARELGETVGPEKLVFSVDSRGGKVSVAGWTEATMLTPAQMIRDLEPYCSAFLYTHIDAEGLMRGFPLEVAEELRRMTQRRLIVAGGVTTQEEVDRLDAIGADAVVGMAIYTGKLAI